MEVSLKRLIPACVRSKRAAARRPRRPPRPGTVGKRQRRSNGANARRRLATAGIRPGGATHWSDEYSWVGVAAHRSTTTHGHHHLARRIKSLRRSPDNRVLGGVCGAIVRVVRHRCHLGAHRRRCDLPLYRDHHPALRPRLAADPDARGGHQHLPSRRERPRRHPAAHRARSRCSSWRSSS